MKNLFIILFIFSILSAIAQKKKTYFDKATTVEVTSGSDSIQAMLDDYERIQLPPLSVFLESVYDHPSIKIYEAKKDEANAEMKVTKREWLDYFRVYGQYQYGRLVQLSSHETVEYPEYLTSLGSNQHTYSAGISVSIPFGDLFSRGQKVRARKARFRQLDYEYEISIEERKLKILEQDFINGKIDITTLAMERGRRSGAVISYQEGRATLHNAVTLLEMLTNVKIINR